MEDSSPLRHTREDSVIRALYEEFKCRVVHNNSLTEAFDVQTGVRQGCILSPILFSLAIDWLMCNVTQDQRQGIKWTFTSILEDLDYADDIVLLSSRFLDIQQKTSSLADYASMIGLKVNTKKTKAMRCNAPVETPITLNGKQLEEVNDFSYLRSKMSSDGDCEKEIDVRISKANQAFAMLRNIWKSKTYSLKTKLKIYRSNVLSVLLYGSECWKSTSTINRKIAVFQNKFLRRIMRVFWPNVISNESLHNRIESTPICQTVKSRRWRWMGHVCLRPRSSLIRTAFRWTPQGKRKRGHPKETWRRTVVKELRSMNLTLDSVPVVAADRNRWRALVSPQAPPGAEEE